MLGGFEALCRCYGLLPFQVRDGPVNLVGGGGGGEWKSDFWAFFFAAIRGLQIFFSGHVPCNFFGRGGEGGGLKLGLY